MSAPGTLSKDKQSGASFKFGGRCPSPFLAGGGGGRSKHFRPQQIQVDFPRAKYSIFLANTLFASFVM
jgi:hypothetical protein